MIAPTMPPHDWVFPANLVRVIDGDTQEFMLDLGFTIRTDADFRLLGINTPEVVGVSKAAGLAAKEYAVEWVRNGYNASPLEWPFRIQTRKSADREKYGRWLATVWRLVDGRCLNSDLVEAGHAVPYLIASVIKP
jgi:endonuclease YncB( thermonuclease family)